MTDVIEEKMLILVDGIDNHNKFYHAVLLNSGNINIRYGRVGGRGATVTQYGGRGEYDKIIRSKIRKGYEETDILTDQKAVVSSKNSHLSNVAKRVLSSDKGNKELDALIDRLVAINRHEIIKASGGMIKVDADSGRISTPLGLISLNSVTEARRILASLESLKVADPSFLTGLQSYLKLVPQKVPAKRGWHETFLSTPAAFVRQNELLDQLTDSIRWAMANKDASDSVAEDDEIETKYEKLFQYKIGVLDSNSNEYSKIYKKFNESKNRNHNTYGLKLKRVFTLSSATSTENFDSIAAEIRNVKQLWHGTSAVNLLNVLRRGLFVPPNGGSQIATVGRMFGDGVYFSDVSTKSLQYSRFSHKSGDSCFMLLADVAMGSEYRPNRSAWSSDIVRGAHTTKNKFGKPWNSISVKGGTSGVLNNEMIVWNTDQIKLTYICEFSL